MERGRKRYQRDWDDENPYEYEERPRRRVRRKHRRRVWPTLLGGCALGIVLTVLAAGVIVFLAIRSSQGMGNTGLPIPIIGGGTRAFTHEDTHQVTTLSALTQLQVCNKIGNVAIRVDPNAPTPTVTTKKTVQANSQADADQEFGRILVEVQPPGTITQPLSCMAAQTTSTPTTSQVDTTSSLIVNVTLPANQGLLHSNTDAVDVTVTLPPNILPLSPGPTTFVLNVGVAAGNITVDGINGVLNIRGSSGDVTVSNASLADNSHLSTGEGNITFNGTLTLPTDTNAIARFYLQSEHGNIDVTLPGTTNVTLDANTNVGKITSDFPITVQDLGSGSQSYHGPLNPSAGTAPASTLILDVSTGNVTIHKA